MQGKFFTCKKDRRHYFHYQCRTLRNNVNYCPHCGDTSDQIAVMRRAGATLPDKLTVSTTLPSNSGQQHSMRREAAGGALLKITSQLWANRRKEQAAAVRLALCSCVDIHVFCFLDGNKEVSVWFD